MKETMKELSRARGYQSLKQSVLRSILDDFNRSDMTRACNRFVSSGCPYGRRDYLCRLGYCNKFQWVIGRALHYAHKTGLDASFILDKWEENRKYYWPNYYQNSNFPKITSDVIVLETGSDILKLSPFVCPRCGGISTDPVTCNSGIIVDRINHGTGSCDWKAYGFFRTLSQNTYVFLKDEAVVLSIFTPLHMNAYKRESYSSAVSFNATDSEGERQAPDGCAPRGDR